MINHITKRQIGISEVRIGRKPEEQVPADGATGQVPEAVHVPSQPSSPRLEDLLSHEVEAVIGFELPASARVHRPWWGNQRRGNGHSHALAWSVAGWETAEVDMEAETLLFRRTESKPVPRLPLNEAWPVHPTAVWPEALSLNREDLYEDRI